MGYPRGAVLKGPDVLGPHSHRPYVCLSDETHPFSAEEALYTAVTTTPRSIAIPVSADDFVRGSLSEDSYVNPWTITVFKHADIVEEHGQLTEEAVTRIAMEAASYLGVGPPRE